jgi:hypothetical protein
MGSGTGADEQVGHGGIGEEVRYLRGDRLPAPVRLTGVCVAADGSAEQALSAVADPVEELDNSDELELAWREGQPEPAALSSRRAQYSLPGETVKRLRQVVAWQGQRGGDLVYVGGRIARSLGDEEDGTQGVLGGLRQHVGEGRKIQGDFIISS